MSTKEIKALTLRFFEEFNKGKAAGMAAIDEICDANVIYHNTLGMDVVGINNFKQAMSSNYDAVPDGKLILDDIIVEGDEAALRYTSTGTHTGTFMGIPPTNKKVTIWILEIDRFSHGKIVEIWARTDTLGLMQQLGVVPMPKK